MSKILPRSFDKVQKMFIFPLKVLSAVASQFISYNEYIKINENTMQHRCFFRENSNHIGDLFKNNSKRKKLGRFKGKIRFW